MKKLFAGLALALSTSSLAFATATTVSVSGRKLLVSGQAFTVQGVNYSPVPYGHTVANTSNGCLGGYQWWTDRPTYVADFPIISRMGANTIRTFDLMNSTLTVTQVLAALDTAQSNGLKVIMGYSVPVFQGFHASTQAVHDDVLTSVANYKDHPAVLMWVIGNEVNLAQPEGHDFLWSSASWYSFLDSLAQEIKQIDTNHPVGSAEGEIQNVWGFNIGNYAGGVAQAADGTMTHLDLWAANLYRGPTFQGMIQALSGATGKPLLISEFGKDAYHDAIAAEDGAMQATYLSGQWTEIMENLASGGTSSQVLIGGSVFEWTDEWWKVNQNTCFTHDTTILFNRSGDAVDPNYQDEWFGLASIMPVDAITNPFGTERVLRPSYTTMQAFWNPSAAARASGGSFFSDTVRNYPNPFRLGAEATKFVVLANEAGSVDLRIYDAGGQFVTSLERGVPIGRTEMLWDGHNRQGALVSPGLYFVRIHGKGVHEDTQFRRVVGVK